MGNLIMSIETIKIKDFIFSTNKLKVIRGASYLLDYLNQIEVRKILEDNGVAEKDIIYVGAGNAKFFISETNEKRDTEKVAEKIKKEVEEVYFREAPGMKLAIAYKETEYETNETNKEEKKNGKKVWEDIDDLAKEVAIQKSKGFAINNMDLPFIEKCELCGDEMAEVSTIEDIKKLAESIEIWELDEKDYNDILNQIKNLAKNRGKICESCFKKIVASNKIKSIKEDKEVNFYHYLENKLKDKEMLKSINSGKTIEDYEGDKSFVGFVYADGDGLGDFLKNAGEQFKSGDKSEKEYIEFLQGFSKTLDEKTKESLLETINDVFKDLPKDERVAEFLIVGGDDVCAVFKPNVALKVSYIFQKKFEEKMKKYTEKYISEEIGITSSSGVIIAKSKTPMFHLFDQALSLQKSAKAKRYELQAKRTGFIDFQVIGSEGCVSIKDFRKKISKENNLVMERPYAINENYSNGKAEIDKLIEIVNKLKAENFPKTKIRYIYDLKRNSELLEFEKKMEFINILSKMDKKHIKLVRELFMIDEKNYNTFNNLFTNIFDILEMYDFIGGEKIGN